MNIAGSGTGAVGALNALNATDLTNASTPRRGRCSRLCVKRNGACSDTRLCARVLVAGLRMAYASVCRRAGAGGRGHGFIAGVRGRVVGGVWGGGGGGLAPYLLSTLERRFVSSGSFSELVCILGFNGGTVSASCIRVRAAVQNVRESLVAIQTLG